MTDVTDLAERLIEDIDAIEKTQRNLAVYERDARLVAREYVALFARLAQAEQERDEARETKQKLHRRTQEAESERDNCMKLALKHQTCENRILLAEARLREYEEALTGEGIDYTPEMLCELAAELPHDAKNYIEGCADALAAKDTDG